MTNYQYLIVGGGMTAAAAVDGIREVDSAGGIGLLSAEPDAPSPSGSCATTPRRT